MRRAGGASLRAAALISERVTACLRAPKARGKHLGRPAREAGLERDRGLATCPGVGQIQAKIAARAGCSVVGEITRRARAVVTVQ